MLRDIIIKEGYDSEVESLLDDFYVPALKQSQTYWRMSGYFSASALFFAAQGFVSLLNNDGSIRLVLGHELDDKDFNAIADGVRRRELFKKINGAVEKSIAKITDEIFANRLKAVTFLIEMGRLEIRIALRKQGIFHKKIGLLFDENGDSISFSGSNNETAAALLPEQNSESLEVFKSWIDGQKQHHNNHIEQFEALWENRGNRTQVYEFDDAAKNDLITIIRRQYGNSIPKSECSNGLKTVARSPSIPKFIQGKKFSLMPHQIQALTNWRESKNAFQGIFALATGAGKTITAICGAVKLFEARKKLFVVIAVPYQNLADQWIDNLLVFDVLAIPCYRAQSVWKEKLSKLVFSMSSGERNFGCVVVVNNTLKSETFSSMVGNIQNTPTLFIGDECHHHNSSAFEKKLPDYAEHRMGLSATPLHYFDQKANDRLQNFYGDVIAEYSLAQALEDKVLTPYEYFIHPVALTEDEADEYSNLSHEIARCFTFSDGDEADPRLTTLLSQRARLLGSAENKIVELKKILSKSEPTSHSLFYCGDGSVDCAASGMEKRQIEIVSQVLFDFGWKTSRFTAKESRNVREQILTNFSSGLIDGMVAIKCLDEGIDVPKCSQAFILASSSNPRQFIQRRGRILRRAEKKDKATIHDFLVFVDRNGVASGYDEKLVLSELSRVKEFMQTASNRFEVFASLEPVLDKYGYSGYL